MKFASEEQDKFKFDELMDEYRLLVHPIVVGGGKRLFAEGTPETELNLTESRELGSGEILQVYEPVRS